MPQRIGWLIDSRQHEEEIATARYTLANLLCDWVLEGHVGQFMLSATHAWSNYGMTRTPEEYLEIDSIVPRTQALALAILRLRAG